jgi:hypothetical protein
MPDHEFTSADLDALAEALRIMNSPSLAIRLANAVGIPIERLIANLPPNWSGAVTRAAGAAIQRALEAAVSTMDPGRRLRAANAFHKLAVGASGGIGGFFGVGALVVELPVSTTLMLRSIADIARSEGEDVRSVETRLACLEVFALGGLSAKDDAADAGYYAVRAALAAAMREAAEYLAERGVASRGAPVLVRLISQIASRFSAAVSEKVAAQAVPVVGAVGGAAVNLAFIDHFQNMARAHFTIRRLERRYGPDAVRAALEQISARANL